MRKSALVLTVATLVALPAAATAQGFGVAARAGTLGIGAEAAVGLSSSLVVRGGLGLMPLTVDATRFWDVGQGVTADLKLPKSWYNIGVDIYPGGGSFRIGGGMLYKPDDPTITGKADATASFDIGGHTYTASDVAEIKGALSSKSSAPYVLIGFGNHTKSGLGLFLDLGVAFMGEPTVTLEATSGNSTIINSTQFKDNLEAERQKLENDLPTWAKKYWPIANIGIKLGVG